tara:strand:- start:413 stop:4141 length:3729 start_codon:yes stop_codon:yes gene_type:complete
MSEEFEPQPEPHPSSEESIFEPDSKKLNPWTIIETYFRDNPNYKSQHQIDSFDEFIFSKRNGIEYILKRENPQIIYKEEIPGGDSSKYRYEINLYYGETLDEKTGLPMESVTDNVFVSSPIEYSGSSESEEGTTAKYMYPNVARLKGYTYGSCIFCNIGVIFKENTASGLEMKVVNFEKVNIGLMPIMVKSKLCILNDLDSTRLSELGECPFDQGGYFIIKGKEKVILSQEKKINNILYINSSNNPLIPLEAAIKSVSSEGFQSSRRNSISMNRVIIKVNPANPELAESGSRHVHRLTVRILGIEMKIPLFVLFRCLGYESDKKILSTIIYDNDHPTLKKKLLDLLEPSIKDAHPIFQQKFALKLLAMHTKNQEIINVIDILTNSFLPNYKTNEEKAQFTGFMTRKLLLTSIGAIKETDRDSYAMKRIDLAGSLLLELYRELWSIFQRNVSLKIDTEYKFNFKEYGNDIKNLITTQNLQRVFNTQSMDSIVKSFGSVFGTGLSGRQGIVQDLNRAAMLGTLSHLRRLSNPLPPGSQSFGPRKLHNSQWGFVCPSESPDGGNVGIINHLSISTIVSFNVSETGITEALLDHGMITLSSVVSDDLQDTCKVFLNGKFVGIHRDPEFLYKLLRLLKLNSIIHIHTCIYWDIEKSEFYVFTDDGRLLRPIFVLRKIGPLKTNELIEGNHNWATEWNRLIRGKHMYDKYPEFSIYDDTYHKQELQEIKELHEDYLLYLEDHQSQIEYVDPLETEAFLIGKSIDSLDKMSYTHCEIHSSLMLSAVALNIPFPEHSQYPRNVFSCQQTKQAVGVYSSAFNTRFDTFAHVLNYAQKPIVTTRYKKYTDVDKLPYGVNAIVAIASYSGYNQEDALIVNKTSVDRGMFQSLYYRSYEDNEEMEGDHKVYFGNPNHKTDTKKESMINFDKLDVNGFVKEGSYVDSTDAITGKYSEEVNSEGKTVKCVSGKTIKIATSGIVDKVIVSKNKDNLRSCKVRIRKSKIPTVGDKYSSRPGQKGMCGLVLEQSEMPFTKDGIVPDMIINPHAIPSRMTVNQLLEVVLGKSACLGGFLGDATPFQNNDVHDYAKLMEKYGYESWGNEIMYSGITGEQLKTSIFIGPTYYQRLKIMVADKMHSRGTGPMQTLIRQPAAGRSNNGGLRIGEMERDSILAHGISDFLRESMMERSDKFSVQIDETTGLINYDEQNENQARIEMPYAMKMLLQEIQTMSIAPRLITDRGTENPVIAEHIMNNF